MPFFTVIALLTLLLETINYGSMNLYIYNVIILLVYLCGSNPLPLRCVLTVRTVRIAPIGTSSTSLR